MQKSGPQSFVVLFMTFRYIPQNLQVDYKFKPFVPEYLPAVGDIDAFLKVLPPETTLTGRPFSPDDFQLGIVVLDEPVANQSDPALLNLQLRASSINISNNANIVSGFEVLL